jgi:asparagine synthase (glutamine-hydrolysing)
MSDAITHRGPDDSGHWWDEDIGLALGHRRLSIVDLSAEGHQPMVSRDGRFVIVFNGEIYNFEELRSQLVSEDPALRFRGDSDTEVMLEAFTRWGIDQTVRALNGMFAFALWDRRDRRLTLGRDRIGEKPLYYGYVGGVFAFASELKALRMIPGAQLQLDRGSLSLYMRYSCVPGAGSIYQGIQKLPPGCLVSISSSDRAFDLPKPDWQMFKSKSCLCN